MVVWQQSIVKTQAAEHHVPGSATPAKHSLRLVKRRGFILEWQRNFAPMGSAPSHVSQHQKRHGAMSVAVSSRRVPKQSLGNASKAKLEQQSLQGTKSAPSQEQARQNDEGLNARVELATG